MVSLHLWPSSLKQIQVCVCAAVYPIAQEIRSCEDSTQTSKNRQETNILRTYFLEVLLGIRYS